MDVQCLPSNVPYASECIMVLTPPQGTFVVLMPSPPPLVRELSHWNVGNRFKMSYLVPVPSYQGKDPSARLHARDD
jgi:hypothetical protein